MVPNHLSNSILTGKVLPKEVSPKKILKSENLSSLGLHLVSNLWPPKGLTFKPHTITFPLKDFGLSFSNKVIPKDFILRSYLLLPSKILKVKYLLGKKFLTTKEIIDVINFLTLTKSLKITGESIGIDAGYLLTR